jgi:hypothetical protein
MLAAAVGERRAAADRQGQQSGKGQNAAYHHVTPSLEKRSLAAGAARWQPFLSGCRSQRRSSSGWPYVPTRADAPEIELDEDFWRDARVVVVPPGKPSVHLRIDADVLAWFKAQGRGHLTRMSAVLRLHGGAPAPGPIAGICLHHLSLEKIPDIP